MDKSAKSRKFYLLLCFLFYFLVSVLFIPLNVNGQSLLWKITGDNLNAASYLYGTIHIKDKRVFEFNDSVLATFEKCKALALEVDLSAENIVLLSQKMILPGDTTLRDLLTDEEYQLAKTVVEGITGLDISIFDRLKPVTLLSLVMNYQFANDVDVSVDEFFYRKAKELDKKIVGLETINEQLEIMENIPNDYIIDYFRNIDQAKEDMEIIINLYRSAELEDLLEMMKKDKSMVMIKKNLLTDRNIKMVESIQKIISEQPVFIAVGAGHLPGKKGIIHILRNEGYSVEPVN